MENKLTPNFLLQDQDGNNKSLNDYAGRWLVLYIYPKDNTPGCTKEACTFRDQRYELAKMGDAEVVGVSKDSVASHKKFAEKHHLNFTLLSDPNLELIKALNSYQPKTIFGKTMLGVKRNTFLIDPKGLIVKEYLGVDPTTNASEILEDLKTFRNR